MLLIQATKEENQVRICFENEGDTIPEESQKRIFDKFYRADASRSSSTGGAGLGACHCKRDCRAAQRDRSLPRAVGKDTFYRDTSL